MKSPFTAARYKYTILTACCAAVLIGSMQLSASAQQTSYNGTSGHCALINADASPIVLAPPEMPAAAASYHLTGTTTVQVDLSRSGEVLNASVARTSGVPILDRAAIASIRASTFHPRIRDCSPVASTSGLVVDFRD